jgi:hypothetical protein
VLAATVKALPKLKELMFGDNPLAPGEKQELLKLLKSR